MAANRFEVLENETQRRAADLSLILALVAKFYRPEKWGQSRLSALL
jgi:hypothetical protein